MTFLAGLGSAVGDLASSALSGLFGQNSAQDAMNFQRRMSNTAHQRAARDLEKAGLNRILAYGNPASTPSGQTASMPDAKIGSSFQAGSSAKAQRNVQAATENLIKEQQTTQLTQQQLNATQAAAIAQELDSKIALNESNAKNASAQALAAATAAKRGSGIAEISAAVADLVKSMRDPSSASGGGILPTIVEKLPKAVLGPKGVSSARSVGRWIHDKLHGTAEERQLYWDTVNAQDAQKRKTPVPKTRSNPRGIRK